MGDRGHIHIADTGVYLYTHWEATELPETLARVLSRGARLNDPSYLARIIFDEMVGDDQGGETDYGIDTAPQGDAWRILTVDCSERTVTFDRDRSYSDDEGESYSFEEFIEAFA